MSPEDPLFILLNAGSGRKDADATEETIRGVLTRAGRRHDLWRVEDPEQLQKASRRIVEQAREGGGVVVAAGGDGTINAVAHAVLSSGQPFGVLPQGTFNYFSRAHGIPADTAEAVDVLLAGVVRPVRVGMINDRIFLVNASVGLYPKVLEDRETHTQYFGRNRVVAICSAAVTLLRPHRWLVMNITLPGETKVLGATTLIVANNPLQLEQLGVAEAEAVRQGQLAAILLQPAGTVSMLRLIVRGALGKLGTVDNIITFPFERLTVQPHGRRRIKVAVDGEVTRLDTPLLFRVAPYPLQLIVPAVDQRSVESSKDSGATWR